MFRTVMLKLKFDVVIKLVIFTLIILVERNVALRDFNRWKCVPIKIDFCKNIGYNDTLNMEYKRNPFTGKDSQKESQIDLYHYEPLIRSNCSQHLRLLLCSVYLPYCSTIIDNLLKGCRSLCEEVKRKCYRFMEMYYIWPDHLDCGKFPKQNSSTLCLNGGLTIPTPKTTHVATKVPSQKTIPRTKTTIRVENRILKITSTSTYCRVLYSRNRDNYMFIQKAQACALGCTKDGLFTYNEKLLVEKWLSVLACTCGLLCMMALIVIAFDYHKTCYPERTIIFITVCYLFCSLAYVIRIVSSREGVSCQEENGRRYLLIDGSGNITCAATFLLLYCFSMAQNIWCVILSLTWFLSAGMKWRPETIKSISTYFHVAAWGAPCAKTVVILVLRKIDVNELTGICSIGNRYENLFALRTFVLGPLFTFLIMGTIFLLFGFVALFRISSNCADEQTSRTKLQRPLLPIAIYAALHTFFSTYILASYFYEYVNKTAWYNDPTSSGPNFGVFLLRLIMEFFIGITAAFWLLTIHLPRLYVRIKLKMRLNSLDHSVLDPLRTGTNETSI